MVVVERESGGSATTVLVSVLIVVIIGLAFYFGFKGHRGTGVTNINVTAPAASVGGGTGASQY